MKKGTPAKLYINDDKRTVDTIEHTFDGNTVSEIQKELKSMAKSLRKENSTWWYQGEFYLDGVQYSIGDDSTIEPC